MVDQDLEEFVALCAAIVSDGQVTEDDAYQLGDWLNHHEAASEHWPCKQLIEPLQAVWAGGAANPQELQRLAGLLMSVREEWARRHPTEITSAPSEESPPIYSYVPTVPAVNVPVARSSPPPPPASPQRSFRWVLAAGSVTILLVAAGLFAAREIKSAHEKPAPVSSSPIVRATPVPSVSSPLTPTRSAPVQPLAKSATPSAAWTVVTRQSVKAKVGKKEIVIPKGTTVKVIARSNRDLMVSYKGEDLTIPASATSPR